MKIRGFVLGGSLLLYGGIAAGVALLGMGAATWVQTKRLESCKTDYAEFKAKVKVAGEAADKANREREGRELKLKEKTDADHKATVARLNRDLKRVRDDNARRSLTPEAPTDSKRPDLACFERADFARALRDFETEVLGIVGEGTANTIDLDAAKRWAQALPQ